MPIVVPEGHHQILKNMRAKWSNMPKPSVGRTVHYVSYGTPGGEYPSTCRAAMITHVVTSTATDHNIVCLTVFNPEGMFFNQGCRHDEETKQGGTWHWPERVDD